MESGNTSCTDCPYCDNKCSIFSLKDNLSRIGAMAILRTFPKKRVFDPNKVLTCVTADQAKVGMKGYFADNLATLREEFARNNIQTLTYIFNENRYERFETDNGVCCIKWVLFYPIDEELAE